MPLLSELAQLHPEIESVCNHLGNQPYAQGEDYILRQNGEMNHVLVGMASVIKVPRGTENNQSIEEIAAAQFESRVVAELNNSDDQPPLILPDSYDVSDDYPAYAVFSRVPGTVLSHEQARNFNPAEKEAYGRQLGLFIAWLGNVISFEQYGKTIDLFNPETFDRTTAIAYEASMYASRASDDGIPEFLGNVLLDVHDEYRLRLNDGSLEPTIIGHDDLREGNLTFTRHLSKWALSGVFDFGITKLSSPERELRHLATLGPDVLEPGIGAYESQTGAQLSRDLIQFWALAQTATNYAASLRTGNISKATSKHRDLKTLLPKLGS
jgi:aminoglycoside phosphotransferase (APT) family kinase protein